MNREIIKNSAWDKVNLARHKDRPTGSFYIKNIYYYEIFLIFLAFFKISLHNKP